MINNRLTKEHIKKQVEVLRRFLSQGTCEKCATPTQLSQSSALNVVSKMYGFENWNTLNAYLKKQENNNDM